MSIDNGPQVDRRDLVAFPAEPARTGDQGLVGAETWDIDENSSSIFFVIRNRHTSLRGEFNKFSGVLTFDRAPERSRVGVKIVAASISTGHAQRDAALRGAPFLDAARFPWLVFHSTSVRHLGGQRYVLTGELTVRDVTRPVILDLTTWGWWTTPGAASGQGSRPEPRSGSMTSGSVATGCSGWAGCSRGPRYGSNSRSTHCVEAGMPRRPRLEGGVETRPGIRARLERARAAWVRCSACLASSPLNRRCDRQERRSDTTTTGGASSTLAGHADSWQPACRWQPSLLSCGPGRAGPRRCDWAPPSCCRTPH